MTHTKGPWTLETVRTSCGVCHKIGPFPPRHFKPDEPTHACVYVDYPAHDQSHARDQELLANATLIAAAPDLLEALEAAQEELRLIRMKDCDVVYNPGLRVQITAALSKARAAG